MIGEIGGSEEEAADFLKKKKLNQWLALLLV